MRQHFDGRMHRRVLSEAHAVHTRGQRHRGRHSEASKQRTSAIGQHVATKAVRQMPWEASLGLDRRLADALVGEGTAMFKVPALSLTDDAIEVNISDHFPILDDLAKVPPMSILSNTRSVLEHPKDHSVRSAFSTSRCSAGFFTSTQRFPTRRKC